MYQPGDVVLCKFPFRQDPSQFTVRPALVMRVINNWISYKLAQITSTDRRDKLCGAWIKQKSNEGMKMRLRNDSFINLSNILEVPAFGISRLLGNCPVMADLEKICVNHGIKY